MANSIDDKQDKKQPLVILIAYLKAHLVSGEVLELLPIRHENDVKSDVIKLLEDWTKTGFLLRGNIAYPWHQVKQIEVTRVEELAPHEVHQRMLELEGAGRAQLQNGFWKTRETTEDAGKNDGKQDDNSKKDEK